MSKFARVERFFNNFIASNMDVFSAYERKLINLIKANFDNIADVGTQQGKRAKLLSQLIQKNGPTTSDLISTVIPTSSKASALINKLKELHVKNFRGFVGEKTITLDKSYVFLYGANGSGKSSFCEALEYCMLGYVKEAQNKRIDIAKYIKNSVSNEESRAMLVGTTADNTTQEVQANGEIYEYCFVEKNRIDSFARVSSHTPADQTQLLSGLFGIDDFANYISGFTENFSRYLVEGTQANILALTEAKKQIALDSQTIANYYVVLEKMQLRQQEFAIKSGLAENYNDLERYICGYESTLGRIKDIENALQISRKSKLNIVDYIDLKLHLETCEQALLSFQTVNREYSSKKEQLSLKSMYEAVLIIKNSQSDRCPLCHTPIDIAVVNPYINAQGQLQELESIALLEQKKDEEWKELVYNIKRVMDDISKYTSLPEDIFGTLNIVIPTLLNETILLANSHIIESIGTFIHTVKDGLSILEEVALKVKSFNLDIDESNTNRSILELEKQNLLLMKDKIIELNTEVKTQTGMYTAAKGRIDEFESANAKLIEAAAVEQTLKDTYDNYGKAYNSLVNKLNKYIQELPIQMAKDLNEHTRDFYNAINRTDEDHELIECIELPVAANSFIKVWFKDKPEKMENALHILSEGHIRCLGLSILLAKAVHENVPFIIFDDIVNAVDDDHRGGIRELFIRNPHIKDRQLILTSHAEEFIKDLDNEVGVKHYAQLVNRVNLLKLSIRGIHLKETTSNYLRNAQEAKSNSMKREVLQNCRCALENIADTLWKKIAKDYNSRITVNISPGNVPDLMSKITGLRKRLKEIDNERFNGMVGYLEYLQGLEMEHSVVWNYLNKGTHEMTDRGEFDQLIVNEVLDTIVALDTQVRAS